MGFFSMTAKFLSLNQTYTKHFFFFHSKECMAPRQVYQMEFNQLHHVVDSFIRVFL